MQDNLTLLQLFLLIQNCSNNTYLVGGCVRDMLLNKEPKDYDIVTDFPIHRLLVVLSQEKWEIKVAGLHFAVLHCSKNDQQFEVANYRKDVGNNGKGATSVEMATLEEDAFRRDFTINALYLNPITNEIKDPTEKGLKDIADKTLRFVGKPEDRIKEDYIRIFRFYRFIKNGFIPHPKSLKACRAYFKEVLTKLDFEGERILRPERIRDEIEKITGANKY